MTHRAHQCIQHLQRICQAEADRGQDPKAAYNQLRADVLSVFASYARHVEQAHVCVDLVMVAAELHGIAIHSLFQQRKDILARHQITDQTEACRTEIVVLTMKECHKVPTESQP